MSSEFVDNNIVNYIIDENRKIHSATEGLRNENRRLAKDNDQLRHFNYDLSVKLKQQVIRVDRCRQEAVRKANAVAEYIRNEDLVRNRLRQENQSLQLEVKNLKTALSEEKKVSEEMSGRLKIAEEDKNEMLRVKTEENNQMRNDFQRLIDVFRAENRKLVDQNKELEDKVVESRQIPTSEEVSRIRQYREEEERSREEMIATHKRRERQLEKEVSLLRTHITRLTRESHENKCIAKQKQRTPTKTLSAQKSLYSNGIKRLIHFGVENNDEVFAAISQLMDKMRVNANKRLFDKSVKIIEKIREKNIEIEESETNDREMDCDYCDDSIEGDLVIIEDHQDDNDNDDDCSSKTTEPIDLVTTYHNQSNESVNETNQVGA